MPVFHTKTIESILEPVAQQVSRLVILHEEAEDGNAMPDLQRPVQCVSSAVKNLVKVGRETINSSDDSILRQDMPASLQRVDQSSGMLEDASSMLKMDPFSVPARKKLIEGSRGILQGTSSLLLCFDESEVRKIIRECKKVLEYLAVAEVIESMDDLVQFVKDLSPCLTKVSRDVDAREKELTHQVHRQILSRCLEQVKQLAPVLICSMKISIQVNTSPQGKGTAAASENRNYLAGRMSDEIHEVIRVLQLTTYDEDEWNDDHAAVMKKAINAVDSKMQQAQDWLRDTTAVCGGVGERAVRAMIAAAQRVADTSPLPQHAARINKHTANLTPTLESLCELRQNAQGDSVQARDLSRALEAGLGELRASMHDAAAAAGSVEHGDALHHQQPAHTLAGRLEQAARWLQHPAADVPSVDGAANRRQLGRRAVQLIVDEARRAAASSGLPDAQSGSLGSLCDDVETLSAQLASMCDRGDGNSPQAARTAAQLAGKLQQLKDALHDTVVGRVVDDMVDVLAPIKTFCDAATAPQDTPGRHDKFDRESDNIQCHGRRMADTARLVAAAAGNKQTSQAVQTAANEVDSLCPQLVNAGQIRLEHADNKAADDHFGNLADRYTNAATQLRDLCDEATDTAKFLDNSEKQMRKHAALCDESINRQQPQAMVDNTSAIAKLANRVLMVAKKEAENSEDPQFTSQLHSTINQLENGVGPMIQSAKQVALNPRDSSAAANWRSANKHLMDCVGNIRDVIGPENSTISSLAQLQLDELAPRRPPPPAGGLVPPRPPSPPTTAEDDSSVFLQAPPANQPIMAAAHGLHQEVAQWSSKDNDIVVAAKRMAQLMAELSQLVRGEQGSKRQLIACSKSIAEASEEVTRLAKQLAHQCTDKRMRTQLLQVCERIPTIGTQLKILSTVKATMLGAQGTEEDQEATDMLVGNAQNLMQAVKETVRATEAASIKMRTDAGIRLKWVRQSPWYQ